MKSIIFAATAGILLASCSSSDAETVTIRLPKDYQEKTLVVSHVTIENALNAKTADDLVQIFDTLEVKDGTARMRLDPAGAARYNIEPPVMTRMQPEFYAAPGETLVVDITSFEPSEYTVSGTPLMEDITAFYAVTQPIQAEYSALISGDEEVSRDTLMKIMDCYDAAVKKFVADNPKSPAVPYAIMELSGDDFKTLYDNMTPEARGSMLTPYADLYNKDVEKMQSERDAEEERKAEVSSGTITAPGFTLPDLQGKMVSLSDFRGKWVVLDFWGSWCGWCIKGFPALKKAYEQYGDKLVIIGIGCNEPEADWRAGVKQHELPWLNLYNGNDRKLYTDYNIEGFPTKAIINPEGKLVDLTTGEDPSFFTRLADFVK